jgi:6-phosphogluconolactonase (cycloisomerase 2 family)
MAASIPRRSFLKGAMAVAASGAAGRLLPAMAAPGGSGLSAVAVPEFAYVGCYTSNERNGHGQGIGVYRIDAQSRAWKQLQIVEAFNPSYVTLDHQRRCLYSVHGDATYVTAYSIDRQTGRLTRLNQQPTGGRNSVHLSVDPSNRFLVVANYGAGTLSVLPIGKNGALEAVAQSVTLQGEPGPNRTEQTASHPHDIPFDCSGRFVVVPDKGVDRIFVFRFDPALGKLIAADPPSVATRVGAGPRHVAFHPALPYAYVINELDSTVTAYHYDSARGSLVPFQIVPTLPASFTGNNTCAEIVVCPSGRFVYASNRGLNSITIFAVDPANGTLTPIGWESTLGETPRFIGLVPAGDWLYAANQDSNSIVAFRVDRSTGMLAPAGQTVNTGSPSCIAFL